VVGLPGYLVIGVATGAPDDFTEVACTGYNLWNFAQVPFEAKAGTTYFIQVGSLYAGYGAQFTFSLDVAFDLTGFTLTGGTANPRTGVPTVTGAVTCNKDVNVSVSGTLRQKIDRRTYANASFSTSVACVAGHATNWSAVGSNDRPFAVGTVSLAANADGSACDQAGCENDSAHAAADVHIKPKC
jgi:hypothetical protein